MKIGSFGEFEVGDFLTVTLKSGAKSEGEIKEAGESSQGVLFLDSSIDARILVEEIAMIERHL